jgi:hypothetical protein
MAPSPQTRDAGVRRVTRLTSWAVAGAVALSAAVSFVVAKAQPGSAASRGATNTSGTATTGSVAPVVIGPGTGGGDGLQPPISAPTGQGGGGSVANSGGS